MNTLDNVKVIGLTGQSGAGKTSVSEIFRSLGFSVINCDAVSRRVADFPEFLAEIKEVFPDCVDESGLLRQKLGAIVFNDAEKLRRYGGIIFPYITAEIFRLIRELRDLGEKIVILDAPTLFESGLADICSAVISVVAPFDLKLKRILERDGVPVEFAKSRLSSQFSEDFFAARSDYLIKNDGDISDLKAAAADISRKLRERFDD